MTATTAIDAGWWDHLRRRMEPLTGHVAAVALIVMAAIVLGQALTKHRTDPGSADKASIVVAGDIYAGFTGTELAPSKERRIRPPGYPLILAAMAYLDPNVASGFSCAGQEPDGCVSGSHFLSVVILQALAAVVSLLLVYRLALRLSGAREIALITLLLVIVWGRFADYAGNLLGHTWYQLGVVGTLYLLVPPQGRMTAKRALAAGIVAGLTALIEPTFIVVVAVAAPFVALSYGSSGLRGSGLRPSASLIAGGVLALVAGLAVSRAAGYDLEGMPRHMIWNLAERAAFNRLDGAAWWAAILVPVPVFGPLFASLFPPEIIDSFGYYRPGTYVFDGTHRILPAALAQKGDAWHQLVWLIRTHILGDLQAYLASSGALLMRGIWVGGALISLIGIFQISPMLRWARIGRRYDATLLVVFVTLALLVAGTLLTSNPIYLHPMLVFIYAYAIAYVAGGR